LATVDNCGGDIRCQPGQPQEHINGGGHTLLARDVVYGQVGILPQADAVSFGGKFFLLVIFAAPALARVRLVTA